MKEKDRKTAQWLASLEESPLGQITCTATENGICAVFFEPEPKVRAELKLTDQVPPQPTATLLRDAVLQINAYLAGNLNRFELPIDWMLCSPFQQRVLEVVCTIPYGQVLTYGQVAQTLGDKNALRAVGGAVAHNPMPLIVPCHRVLSPKNRLRGYSGRGGVKTKAWLLQLEGHFLVTEELG